MYIATVQADWIGGDFSRVIIAGSSSRDYTTSSVIARQSIASTGSSDAVLNVYKSAGTLLCSDSKTFRCERPDTVQGNYSSGIPDTDKADIKSAVASSELPGEEAGKSIDKNPLTAWTTNESLPQSLKLELKKREKIRGVGVYSPFAKPIDWTISTSADCKSFTPMATVKNAKWTGNNWNLTFFRGIDAKCILINVTKSEYQFQGIAEIEVYLDTGIEIPQPFICGNGVCESKSGESTTNCPKDCKAPPEEFPIIPVATAGAIIGAAAVAAFLFREKILLWIKYITTR